MPFTLRLSRLVAALCLTVACTLGGAGAALADSATVSFTDATGKSDPVVDVGRTLTVAGNVAAPTRLYVRTRPAGGAPCAPSAASDSSNRAWLGTFSGDFLYDRRIEGDFKVQLTGNWSTPGTFLYCVWLAPSDATATVPISQTFTFRNPVGTISATTAPLNPAPDTPITLTVSGNSEAPARAYGSVRPAGGPSCASSYTAETGRGLFTDQRVSGAFSFTDTYTPTAAGTYLICLFLAQSESDANPIAVQPITFDVIAPPPPCIVPTIAPGTTLANAQSALQAGSCGVGGQTLTPDPKIARGTVVSISAKAGASFGNGTAINLVISDGRSCKVPASKAGLKLSSAKKKLAGLGCTVGSVKRVKSKRKKGTVVRFSPRAGTTLAPRAVVGISVSRGRK